MSTFQYLRKQALLLPEVEAKIQFGGPALLVRGKTFALWWAEGRRVIMKLRPDHQTFLFEVRADTFQPCRVGTGYWSYVNLERLQAKEVRALVLEAWSTVVPKALSKAVLAKK